MSSLTARVWVSLPLALLCPALGACAQAPPIVIDGDMDDWRGRSALASSGGQLCVRFETDGLVTLQGGQRCTRLLLDTDADGATGMPFADGDEPLGVDLEVQISPMPEEVGAALGLGARAYTHAGGARRSLSHADIGLAFAPTYAADAYELRLGLDAPALARLSMGDRVRGVVIQTDGDGAELWRSETFSGVVDAPIAAVAGAGAIPPAPAGAIRVVSHNVLRASPARGPDAFARLYRALAPDVVLLQEWDGWDAARLAAWFDEHVPFDGSWSAAAHPSDRAGVAVVSRYPVTLAVDEPIHAEGDSWPVRFVGAVIDAPDGPLLAGSAHLKCCGYAGSPEDERRIAEARAINQLVRRILDENDLSRCVLGGDLNLVGSRPPLDLLRATLDADGSDMEPARTLIWGDHAAITWTDADSPFSPGRLDWVVYSDAVLHSPFACVVETARLAPAALAAMGVESDDSRASDHLPLVVDLAPAD